MLYYIKHEVIGSVVQQIDEGVSTRYVQHQSTFLKIFKWGSHRQFYLFTGRRFSYLFIFSSQKRGCNDDLTASAYCNLFNCLTQIIFICRCLYTLLVFHSSIYFHLILQYFSIERSLPGCSDLFCPHFFHILYYSFCSSLNFSFNRENQSNSCS